MKYTNDAGTSTGKSSFSTTLHKGNCGGYENCQKCSKVLAYKDEFAVVDTTKGTKLINSTKKGK